MVLKIDWESSLFLDLWDFFISFLHIQNVGLPKGIVEISSLKDNFLTIEADIIIKCIYDVKFILHLFVIWPLSTLLFYKNLLPIF